MAAIPLQTNYLEGSLVFSTVHEFMQSWASGKRSSLYLECDNGEAWLQIGFRLSHPNAFHGYKPTPSSPPPRRPGKSPSKRKRDKESSVLLKKSRKKSVGEDKVVLEETEATAGDMDMNNKSDNDDSNKNICSMAVHVSKPAPSNYSFHQVAHIDIAPVRSTLDKLSINSQSSISIPPRPVYTIRLSIKLVRQCLGNIQLV